MKWYYIFLLIIIIPIGAYLNKLAYTFKYGKIPFDSFIEKHYYTIQEWREKRRLKKIRKDKEKDYGC